ncbi:MAG: hypothetical protein ACRDIF_04680 [Actinomycetota bacterium]
MRMEATCQTCRRRFLLAQILPAPEGTSGRCPFCGANYGRHYLAMLPSAIRTAETAAETFVASLKRLNDTNPGFSVDVRKLMEGIEAEVSGAREHESA